MAFVHEIYIFFSFVKFRILLAVNMVEGVGWRYPSPFSPLSISLFSIFMLSHTSPNFSDVMFMKSLQLCLDFYRLKFLLVVVETIFDLETFGIDMWHSAFYGKIL